MSLKSHLKFLNDYLDNGQKTSAPPLPTKKFPFFFGGEYGGGGLYL